MKTVMILMRDDGALNVHPPEPGPATCCDGRMVYIFVNRGGVTMCPSCDARRAPEVTATLVPGVVGSLQLEAA